MTAILVNDHFNSKFEQGKFSDQQFLPKEAKGTTSTPLAITYQDSKDGNNLGSAQEPKKIIISNFNELATIPMSAQEGLTMPSEEYDYAPSKVSERLTYNPLTFTAKSFTDKYPNIKITGRVDDTTIKRLSDTLDLLPPKVVESIKGFEVFTDEEWAKGEHANADAFISNNNIIRLKQSDLRLSTVYHEAAHGLHRNIRNSEFLQKENMVKPILEMQNKLGEIGKKHGYSGYYTSDTGVSKISQSWEMNDQERNQFNQILQEYQKGVLEYREGGFQNKWKKIATSGYVEVAPRTGWAVPKYGFIRLYGSTEQYQWTEDIATYMEVIYTKGPEFFKPLITEGNPQYDSRYRQKLELLQEYGFITKDKYNEILGTTK